MINVKRTCIEITPYTKDNRNLKLEEMLSVYDPITFSSNPLAFYYDTDNEILKLPRSLGISKLEAMFNEPVNIDKGSDDYERAVIKLKTQPRNENQIKAISFFLGKGDFENIKNHSRILLEGDTGFGKTYCSVAAIAYAKEKGAIILNKDSLLEQWKDKMISYTDLDESEIYIIKGSKSIDKLMDEKNIKYKIFLISHKTLQSYAKKNSWSSITELFKKLCIGVKIYDEAHDAFGNIVKIDFFTNTKKTIYLTATADRSNKKESFIYKLVFGQVPTLVLLRKSEEAFIETLVLKYDSNPSLMQLSSMKTKMGMSNHKYLDYTVFNKGKEQFFKSIDIVLNSIEDKDGKAGFLLGKKSVVSAMFQYLTKIKGYDEDDIGILTSDIKDKKERELQKDKKIILSTYKSLGTGLDIPDLRFMIMCEPFSSKIILKQSMGRLRDIGGKLYYIIILDVGVHSRKNQHDTISKDLLKLSSKVTEFNIE